MNDLVDEVACTLKLLDIDCSANDIRALSMAFRCKLLSQLLQRAGHLVKVGSINERLMDIYSHLKSLKISCKRTCLVDVRPSENLYTIILDICQLLMQRQLDDVSDTTDYTKDELTDMFISDTIDNYNNELLNKQHKAQGLVNDYNTCLKRVNGYKDKHIDYELSLADIRLAKDKLNQLFSHPLQDCLSNANNPKFTLEYPTIDYPHPLLSQIDQSKPDPELLVCILKDSISNVQPVLIKVEDTAVYDCDLVNQDISTLRNTIGGFKVEIEQVDTFCYFESIEI